MKVKKLKKLRKEARQTIKIFYYSKNHNSKYNVCRLNPSFDHWTTIFSSSNIKDALSVLEYERRNFMIIGRENPLL